jgi:hypothetical protein
MSTDMRTALWITVVGTGVLFGSLACLIGLMYVLTAPWLFPKDERVALRARRGKGRKRFRKAVVTAEQRAAAAAVEAQADEIEQERRRRAVVLAVAIACAEASRTELILLPEIPSDWRLLYRARRLSGRPWKRTKA